MKSMHTERLGFIGEGGEDAMSIKIDEVEKDAMSIKTGIGKFLISKIIKRTIQNKTGMNDISFDIQSIEFEGNGNRCHITTMLDVDISYSEIERMIQNV